MEFYEDFNQFNELVNQLNLESNTLNSLADINELIKQNEQLRRNANENFYKKVLLRLQNFISNEPLNVDNLNEYNEANDKDILLFKCLRNTAACDKKYNFTTSERSICELLIELVNRHSQTQSRKFISILTITIQYFGNLVQGNRFALESFSQKWLQLGICLLHSNQDAIFVYSSSLVYFLIQKSSENFQFDEKFFFKLFSKSLRITVAINWPVKLCEAQFQFKYLYDFNANNFTLAERIGLFELVKANSKQFKSEQDYLQLFQLYEIISKNLLDFLKSASLQLNNQLDQRLYEFKNLLECLNDVLSIDDNLEFLKIAQNQRVLLTNTCLILNEVHKNVALNQYYLELVDNDTNKVGYVNIKCELIRLLGLLAYMNELNCDLIQEANTLESIIENVKFFDIDQPLIREWSIVTLKHLYSSKSTNN